jgi:hypothetical protein
MDDVVLALQRQPMTLIPRAFIEAAEIRGAGSNDERNSGKVPT